MRKLRERTVSKGRGRLFRKNGKYLIFTLKDSSWIPVKLSFKIGGDEFPLEGWKEEL